MKLYSKLYLKIYFIMSLISLVLAFMVLRRTDYQYPFIRIQLGLLVISLIVTLAFWLFKLESKHSVLNTVLGYIVLIPAIFLLRTVYGNYLFRFTWIIYIIVVVVGIIYGVAVYVVSKKYKKEVDELNELLHKEKDETK
ncbi:MAG: DUF3021 family protein [Bacillota bacterium]|nr:MAG: DUF3021 family protein [Bacillota bacterium]